MALRYETANDGDYNIPSGLNAEGDALIHGTYIWTAASTEDDDSWNVIRPVAIDPVDPGRWILSPRRDWTLPQGHLINFGNIRTVFINSTLGSTGEVTVNLTEDNTTNGTAIFRSTIYSSSIIARLNNGSAGITDVELACEKEWANSNKQVTFKAIKPKALLVLGSTVDAGVNGTNVTITITGERLTRP